MVRAFRSRPLGRRCKWWQRYGRTLADEPHVRLGTPDRRVGKQARFVAWLLEMPCLGQPRCDQEVGGQPGAAHMQ